MRGLGNIVDIEFGGQGSHERAGVYELGGGGEEEVGVEEEEEWAERGEEMKPLAFCHTCCLQTSSLPVGGNWE